MTNSKMMSLCHIYKSSVEDELYLYVRRSDNLTRVPKLLLKKFGKPILVTTMSIMPDRKLGRVDTAKVLEALTENGFYLQFPPAKEKYMQEIHLQNHKLSGSK